MKGNKHIRRARILMKQNGGQISVYQKKGKKHRGARNESSTNEDR